MKQAPVVLFGQALERAAAIAEDVSLPAAAGEPLLVRDIYGRVSIALNVSRAGHAKTILALEKEIAELGAYAASPGVLVADDFYCPDAVFADAAIVEYATTDRPRMVRVLDRQVTGQDWSGGASRDDDAAGESRIPRLAFFGLKGGVGRSTALAILAYEFAKNGKRALLIDLDLESPGLSGLLLPVESAAKFGVVDWLVEDAVGQGEEVLPVMCSSSPLSGELPGEIRVAPAMGSGDLGYLDKLSRVYADVPRGGRATRFSERIQDLVTRLEQSERPDVVLIDSRAGMHDLAAVSVVNLASTAFLFATDAPPVWQGYRALFAHWQTRPKVARRVRDKLKVVSALFPETNQLERDRSFIESSRDTFETLYDEVQPGSTEPSEEEPFNFAMEDQTAPHYPLRVRWNARFQEFNPLHISKGLFTDDEIRAAFGNFIEGAWQIYEGARSA